MIRVGRFYLAIRRANPRTLRFERAGTLRNGLAYAKVGHLVIQIGATR